MRWLALLMVFAGMPQALADEGKVLDGPAIITDLAGKTVRGAYADGTSFTETFWPDGKDTYWDPRGTSTGHWSVENNLMCFVYDSGELMSGGCFQVVRSARNCFDFYAAPANGKEGAAAKTDGRYVARASADGVDGTCPVDLQV